MAITPTQLVPTQALTTTSTNVFTAPSSNRAMVKRCTFTNTTASNVSVTLNRVPSGGAVAASNEMLAGITVPANNTYVADELDNMVLESGASIQALASAAGVNISVAGLLF